MKLSDVLALAKMGYTADDVKKMMESENEELKKAEEEKSKAEEERKKIEEEKSKAEEERKKIEEEKAKADEDLKKLYEEKNKEIEDLKKKLEAAQIDNSNKNNETDTPDAIDALKELFRKGL